MRIVAEIVVVLGASVVLLSACSSSSSPKIDAQAGADATSGNRDALPKPDLSSPSDAAANKPDQTVGPDWATGPDTFVSPDLVFPPDLLADAKDAPSVSADAPGDTAFADAADASPSDVPMASDAGHDVVTPDRHYNLSGEVG